MKNKDAQPKESGTAQDRSGFLLIKTCLIFFSIVLAFNLIEWLILEPWQLQLFQVTTAKTAAALISLSGIATKLQGTHVFFSGAHWEIVPECTALQAMYVFFAFIAAYPSSLKTKLLGTVIGIPLLFIANIFRLFVLAWAIQLFPAYAEIVHDYVWQVAFLFLLVLMWLAWIDLVVKREKVSSISC